MAESVTKNTLEAQLERELLRSKGKETFSAKQLRRQIAAKVWPDQHKELYVTGSYSRKGTA